MVEPSYKQRLKRLEALIDEGISLFSRLRESEERLQQQLINGDLQALNWSERERLSIREEIEEMEKRRREVVPEGTTLSTYIRTKIPRSQQDLLLNKTERLTEELTAINTVHRVNKSLMEVSLQFSRRLEQSLNIERITYDMKGQVSGDDKGSRRKLDYNC